MRRPSEGGTDVADDGFDFGQLGHRAEMLMRGARITRRSATSLAASRQPMSRRKTLPSNSIASAAARLRRCASAKVGATAVTVSTRPPLTRRTPSAPTAVPA